MSTSNQRPDTIQWLNKETDRYVKIERATGVTISEKVTAGPYKNIHVAKRRPTIRKILDAPGEGVITKAVSTKVVTDVKAKKKKSPAPKKPRKPRKVNYLNNKDLMIEVLKSKEQNKMTDKLAHMLQTLAARYGKKANFAGYSYNEDMQAFAMWMLVRTWNAFNPEKSQNPFAFFTQCIKNSFIQFLNQEAKHRNTRDALMVNSGLDPSFSYQEKYAAKMAEQRRSSDDVDAQSTERVSRNNSIDNTDR